MYNSKDFEGLGFLLIIIGIAVFSFGFILGYILFNF